MYTYEIINKKKMDTSWPITERERESVWERERERKKLKDMMTVSQQNRNRNITYIHIHIFIDTHTYLLMFVVLVLLSCCHKCWLNYNVVGCCQEGPAATSKVPFRWSWIWQERFISRAILFWLLAGAKLSDRLLCPSGTFLSGIQHLTHFGHDGYF